MSVNNLSVVSNPAPYGNGGMGRHLAEVVEELRASGEPLCYFSMRPRPDDPAGIAIAPRWPGFLSRYTPLRFFRDWQLDLEAQAFDLAVSRRLTPGRTIFAFQHAAYATFRQARRLGYREFHLETATAHVRHLRRMYDRARRRYPIERDWLNSRLLQRTLHEYELADVIWVNSEYARQTFLSEGVSEQKLRRRRLTVDPRFQLRQGANRHAATNFVYVGNLTVTKGVPLLIDAFAQYADAQATLTLVGGSGTRGMRKFLAAAVRRDPRIRICPGDPLPHLQTADLCLHPSYSDGFGYGPAEALACGVPVVVTEETGMKELIADDQAGHVIPADDMDALIQAMRRVSQQVAA